MKLPPVPRTFNKSKSFIVTCNDLVGEGLDTCGTMAFAEASASVELLTWLFDDGTDILFGEMAVPLQITPEIKNEKIEWSES